MALPAEVRRPGPSWQVRTSTMLDEVEQLTMLLSKLAAPMAELSVYR